MVKFDKVSFSYRNSVKRADSADEKPVLADFSLELDEGETVAVMGESGSGKTTLVKLLLALLKPDSGTITGLEGKRVSVVFQEDRLLGWYTALENVSIVLEGAKKERERAAYRLLEEMELSSAADKPISELSGGMQRRVAIARALAYGGDILILDEPLKGLDEELKMRIIKRIMARFKTVLLITHDAEEAEAFGCSRVYKLNH